MTQAWTSEFAVPGPGPYLASHAVGCATHAAIRALQSEFVAPWTDGGLDAWPHWLNCVSEFRAALAAVLGDSSANYCPQPTVSAALHALLGALPRPEQRRVWLAAEATFPSLGFVLQRAASQGFELRLIPQSENPADPAVWERWIDADTAGVLAMHVHSNTGAVAPLADIVSLCRAAGALSVVDIAQSAGVVPLDVAAIGADAVIGSCIKWLCGGPGAAFLWLRPDLADRLTPSAVGWFSHENPFEMNIHSYRDAPGALRFWGGTPSIAPYVCAGASLRVIERIGVPTVFAHNRELVAAFRSELPSAWQARIDAARMGGTICLDVGSALADVRARLAAEHARFDVRGTTLRLSFHVFNTVEEARRVGRACFAGSR